VHAQNPLGSSGGDSQPQPAEPGQNPSSPAPAPAPPAQPPEGGNSAEQKGVDLGKFVSVATTPVGLIIAGAIIISFFEQKRAASSAQVRDLIAELRKGDAGEDRRQAIIAQVERYKIRLRAIRLGALFVAMTLVLFVTTNISASLGLIWPNVRLFSILVIAGMLLGMVTLAASIISELYDSRNNREELNLELSDFDRLAGENKPSRDDGKA
jgi:hypothetical protein